MRKECRISNLWAETGESKLNGSNLVHETTNKIAVIQERLESAKLLKELPWGSDSVPNYDILDYMNFLKIIREVFGSLLLDTIGTSITVIGLITVSLFDSERDRLIIVNGFLCLSVNRLNALMIVVDREHVPFPMFVMIDIEPSQMRIDFDCIRHCVVMISILVMPRVSALAGCDNVVPPPYTGNFLPPKYDLVLANKEEYVLSKSVTSIPDVTTSEAKTSVSKPKFVGEPLIED
ncbi:hypothetical protein Tco_1253853 [Tanacetum coccineum]